MKTTAATRTPLLSMILAAAGLLVLGACVSPGGSSKFDDYVTTCMIELAPTGAITWSDGDTKVQSEGGPAGEEAAMNACIKTKAAAAGDSLATVTPSEAKAVPKTTEIETVKEVEAVGDTVTETLTYGTPPAAPVPPASGAIKVKKCQPRNVLSGGSGYYQCFN